MTDRDRATRRAVAVVKVAIVSLALWGLFARVGASAAPAADGQSLFATGCSSCHGVDGHGITTADGQVRGVDITNAGAALVYFQLSTGRMPLADSNDPSVRKPPTYDDDQIAALVQYVAAFGAGPAMPSVDLNGADLAAGGQVYLANCQACHSAAGSGGALSYGESAPALHQSEPLQVAAAVRSGPGRMPVFGPQVIDQQSLSDVVQYVQYLRNPDDPGGASLGRTGPVPEGFVALTLGIGALLAAVFWIGTRVRVARPKEQHDGPS